MVQVLDILPDAHCSKEKRKPTAKRQAVGAAAGPFAAPHVFAADAAVHLALASMASTLKRPAPVTNSTRRPPATAIFFVR